MTIMTVLDATSPMDERDVQIETLQKEVEALRMEVRGAREAHRADIVRIGERLVQEAEDRNWCDEYDRIVDEVNESLTFDLPLREREYTVEVSGYIRVPFTYSFNVSVPGRRSTDDYVTDAAREAMDNISAMDVDTDMYGAEIEEWEVAEVDQA